MWQPWWMLSSVICKTPLRYDMETAIEGPQYLTYNQHVTRTEYGYPRTDAKGHLPRVLDSHTHCVTNRVDASYPLAEALPEQL